MQVRQGVYEKLSRETYRELTMTEPSIYPILGLTSEVGELAGKFKKLYRDQKGVEPPGFRDEVLLELGDVLWYLTQICPNVGFTLEQVAEANLDKIMDRRRRGVLDGSGDMR